MTVRRSPQLARLPRREIGSPPPPRRIKLLTTWHSRKADAHPQRFCQVTVPADMADLLPVDAVFEVTMDGLDLHYRMVR